MVHDRVFPLVIVALYAFTPEEAPASGSRRPASPPVVEASMDLGATGWQTFRHVLLPHPGTALVAGGMLAFPLSFDEVIVRTFTAGQQQTLPIWIFSSLVRCRARPVTNVVALVVIAVTAIPILLAQHLTGAEGGVGPATTAASPAATRWGAASVRLARRPPKATPGVVRRRRTR